MAHFAQLDENNIVTTVIVVADSECMVDGRESEELGVAFCKSLFGQDTKWIKTSYSGKIRRNFAGIGFTYDPVRDAFIPVKPDGDWVLSEATMQWEPAEPAQPVA